MSVQFPPIFVVAAAVYVPAFVKLPVTVSSVPSASSVAFARMDREVVVKSPVSVTVVSVVPLPAVSAPPSVSAGKETLPIAVKPAADVNVPLPETVTFVKVIPEAVTVSVFTIFVG